MTGTQSQLDALTAADCDKIFVNHASGTLARRPALDDAIAYCAPVTRWW